MPKLYLAGPLFTLAEQSFNVDLARFLKKQGFEVWLPQRFVRRADGSRPSIPSNASGSGPPLVSRPCRRRFPACPARPWCVLERYAPRAPRRTRNALRAGFQGPSG
jgi:hypothetical protein